jgi:IS30 family transposase
LYALESNKYKHCIDKINDNSRLKTFIFINLFVDISPELNSGHLKKLYPNDPAMYIYHETIYSYISWDQQTKLAQKLIKLLPYNHHKRRKKRKFGSKRNRICNSTICKILNHTTKIHLKIKFKKIQLNRFRKIFSVYICTYIFNTCFFLTSILNIS